MQARDKSNRKSMEEVGEKELLSAEELPERPIELPKNLKEQCFVELGDKKAKLSPLRKVRI